MGKLGVRFLGNQISAQVASALRRLDAHQESEMNSQGGVTFSIPQSIDPRAAADALRDTPGVIAVGPILLRNLLDVTPNDSLFNQVNQWDMYALKMPSAWAITEGLTTVKIAVIDTGYDLSNPDLVGKVDTSIVYDLGNGMPDATASIEDKDGHGSDISGIAAADTNNAINVAGVGWNTHLLEARVFPYGKSGANTRDIAAAINWAVTHGAKVINLSLGSATPDTVYEEPAVGAAIAAGVTVVAAAGNDAKNTIDYPAADAGVVAVGASAYCDSAKNIAGSGYEYVASYSNFGARLTLVAPGADPDATQTHCTTAGCVDYLQWIENLDSTQGPFTEQVGLFAGTSQATPHVAGAVALMIAKDSALTPAQAVSILKASADNIADPHQGSGRLNVLNALNQTP